MKRALPAMAFATLPWIAACDVGREQVSDEVATSQADPGIVPELDVDDAVGRALLTYEWSGSAIVGGRETYAVRAESGRVSITPRHHELPDPEVGRRKVQVREGAPIELETVAIARGAPFELGEGPAWIGEDGSLRIDRFVAEEQFANDEHGTEQRWLFEAEPEGEGDLVVRVRVSGQSYGGWDERGHHFVDERTHVGVLYGNATWIDAYGKDTRVPVEYRDGELILTVSHDLVEASAFPAVLDPTVSAELGLTNPGNNPAPFSQEAPAVASNGTDFFVVWADLRNGTSYDIYGGRALSSDGSAPDATSLPIATATSDQITPSIAWNGTNYLVVWADGRDGDDTYDLYGQLLASDGSLSGGEIAIVTGLAGSRSTPDVAAVGSTFVVTWADDRGGTDAVYFGRVSSGGAALDGDGILVASAAVPQRNPRINCANANNCAIVWAQNETPSEDIRAARIDPAGPSVTDGTPIEVATVIQRDLSPDLANDGTNYLVAWRRASDLRLRRFAAATGALVDMTELTIAPANQQSAPAVDFDGTQFYVVWQDSRVNNSTYDIYGARVTTAGVVTDATGILVNAQADTQIAPAVAFNGTRHFVAWQDRRAVGFDIFGTRVTTAGAPQSTAGVAIAKSASRQFGADSLWDGTRFVVVFTDSRLNGDGNYNIKAIRVSRTGSLLDPAGIHISLAANNQSEPSIAFGAGTYLIAWRDKRSGTTDDIYGARLSSTFALLDANGFAISTAAGDQRHPSVAFNGSTSTFLVAWDDARDSGTSGTDIYGCRVTTAAALLDGANGIAISTAASHQERPDVASNGTIWLLTWADRRDFANTDYDVYGNALSGAGAVLGADFAISTAAAMQQHPRVAFDGLGGFFAAWEDERNGNADLYGSRIITAPLSALDPAGIQLTSDARDERRPALALTGSTYFLAWRRQAVLNGEDIDLIGQQFTLAGAPSIAEFTISAASGNEDQPTIAVNTDLNTVVSYHRFSADPAHRAERQFTRRVQFP